MQTNLGLLEKVCAQVLFENVYETTKDLSSHLTYVQSITSLLRDNYMRRFFVRSPLDPLKKIEFFSLFCQMTNIPFSFSCFFHILVSHRCPFLMIGIMRAYKKNCLQFFNTAIVDIFYASCTAPNESSRHHIESFIKKTIHKKSLVNYHHDPSILGGFIIYANGKVLNSSLKKEIKLLENFLKR